jgi:hypothetical protein
VIRGIARHGWGRAAILPELRTCGAAIIPRANMRRCDHPRGEHAVGAAASRAANMPSALVIQENPARGVAEAAPLRGSRPAPPHPS